MNARDLIHFCHFDAGNQPKLRPATVAATPQGGRQALFYASTFKRGGFPPDAIEANPLGSSDEPARVLADYLSPAVDERCFFHGSLMSETHSTDPSVRKFPGVQFPRDPFLTLEEQGEALLLAFQAAWTRLAWLSPAQRAFVLDEIWWRLEDDDLRLALTLVLYDGLVPVEVAALSWRPRTHRLLPRSRSMLARLRRARQVARDDDELIFADESQVFTLLEQGWAQLRQRGRRRKPRVHLPSLPPELRP